MAVSFAKDILPLFRASDVSCMEKYGVQLNDYSYMSDSSGDSTYPNYANARNVYAHLTGAVTPRMPMGGPYWSSTQLQLFDQWITDGFSV